MFGCMLWCISASDARETPHNHTVKKGYDSSFFIAFFKEECVSHTFMKSIFLWLLICQLEPQRALSLTDRRDRSIYHSTAQIVYEGKREQIPWFTWPHLNIQVNFGFIN